MTTCNEPVPRFASIINADIEINKSTNNNYEIIFNNSIISLYQVYSDDFTDLNSQISIFNYTEEEWIKLFDLNDVNPTSILFIKDKKYAYTIEKVDYKNNKMIWFVSTNIIVNYSIDVSTCIVPGKYENVRINVNNLTPIINPCLSLSQVPKFNQLVKGVIQTTKLSDYTFKINFLKSSVFTLYQVRKDINDTTRIIRNFTQIDWINAFYLNQPFKPTAIMENEHKKYVFIIESVGIENNNLIWIVRTIQILNLSTTINTLENDLFGTFSFVIDFVVESLYK